MERNKMNGLSRKRTGVSLLKKIDRRFGDSTLWQFVKFNLVSFSITLLQLALANLLPLIFDGVTAKLPPILRPVFRPDTLFEGPSPYVVDGVVTWGYVLPFFLSNFIANIYGYFVNMKTTFRGKGSRGGLVAYLLILTALILFSTWLQGWITARLTATAFARLARTIAATAAGFVQVAVLFPLEKYVLFRKE
jgi:putative flippase GtrA